MCGQIGCCKEAEVISGEHGTHVGNASWRALDLEDMH